MFLHVPGAWLGMFGWGVMTVAALGTLVWRHPLADVTAKAAAPIGAAFTFMCLVTGSLWGRPMWGTYWVWDARLTSVLVLVSALSRRDCAVAHGRGSLARRTRRGNPYAGRRRSICRSSNSRSSGGTRCTRAASVFRYGRPDHRSVHPCSAAGHDGRIYARCSSPCCSRPCAMKFCAAGCARCG